MARKAARAALTGGLVLAMVGCGSSKPLTRAEFVKQADAICAKGRTELESVFAKFKEHKLSRAQARSEYFKLLHANVDKLGKLHPPKEMQATYVTFVKARRAEADAIAENSEGRNRAATLRQEHATHTAAPLAGKLGLEGC
jgi:hypothetical protein